MVCVSRISQSVQSLLFLPSPCQLCQPVNNYSGNEDKDCYNVTFTSYFCSVTRCIIYFPQCKLWINSWSTPTILWHLNDSPWIKCEIFKKKIMEWHQLPCLLPHELSVVLWHLWIIIIRLSDGLAKRSLFPISWTLPCAQNVSIVNQRLHLFKSQQMHHQLLVANKSKSLDTIICSLYTSILISLQTSGLTDWLTEWRPITCLYLQKMWLIPYQITFYFGVLLLFPHLHSAIRSCR